MDIKPLPKEPDYDVFGGGKKKDKAAKVAKGFVKSEFSITVLGLS